MLVRLQNFLTNTWINIYDQFSVVRLRELIFTGVAHRSPKPGVGSSSLPSRANIIEMKKVIAYIKESYDELVHKVSWPTYSELANSAVVVLYASLLIALVVWGMDVCFQNFMEKIVYPH